MSRTFPPLIVAMLVLTATVLLSCSGRHEKARLISDKDTILRIDVISCADSILNPRRGALIAGLTSGF